MENKEKWCCRWSPTLGRLEEQADDVWGTAPYEYVKGILFGEAIKHPHHEMPTVFFGVYGLPDFYKVWRHKGRKAILWAGTDIIHLKNGYWLEDGGSIKVSPKPFATWLNKHCENYCENAVEYMALKELGIECKVVPSFLGDVKKFPVSFVPSEKVRLYTSVSGDNFEQYGWNRIMPLARENPEVEFHLYGNTKHPFPASNYVDTATIHTPPNLIPSNVFIHGRISKEEMNAEIKEMTGALRLTEFDGFSEILAKSILWGQHPVSLIPYPFMKTPEEIHMLKDMKQPNIEGRDYYLQLINKYPWNTKS